MTQTTQQPNTRLAGWPYRTGAALAGLMILAACASVPTPPTAALQAAEQAIATAEQARVADYASNELTQARINLTAARAAVEKENMPLAQQLAEQARADADLASAKAAAMKAQAVNTEMQKGTDVLTQEMQRNAGAPK